MTVTATPRIAGPFAGNGVTTSYPFDFKVFTKTDLQVTRTTVATGAQVLLVLDSDYSVILNADQEVDPGGTVQYVPAMPVGFTLVILSVLPDEQQTSIANAGNFLPKVLENALDYQAILIQQLLEKLSRTIRTPAGDTASMLLPGPVARAGAAIVFDLSGNVGVSTNIGAQAAAAAQSAVDAEASRDAIDNRIYPGTFAVVPVLRPDGTAIQNGDEYFGTDGFTYVRVAGAWVNQTAAAAASAAAAGVSATAAATSATQANGSKNAAAISEASSAAYAAAAATGAKFFDTIALGNAGVADAGTFGVKAGGADGLIRPTLYRRDSAGTQTLLYSVLPAPEYDAEHRDSLEARFAYGDADGNLVVRIGTAATLDVLAPIAVDTAGALQTSGVGLLPSRTMKYRLAVADADRNLIFAVDNAGKILGDISRTVGSTPLRTGGFYDFDINHFMGYGQSLPVGQATPAISTVQNYDNIMFVRGMRPQYDYPGDSDAVRYASFVPAVEALSPVDATLAETPMTGFGDFFKQLMLVEDGLDHTKQSYQLLLSAPGFGATGLAALSKGSAHFNRMVTQATYGAANAAALNKSYAVQAVTMVHGETDYINGTTQATYYALANTFTADVNTDLKAASGQTKDIPVIFMQIASHKVAGRATPNIALAQLQAEAANPLIYMGGPMYFFDYQDLNNFHLTAASSRWLGAYEALAAKRIVADREAWSPLKPISARVSGNIAYVKFNVPVGHLVLDTDMVVMNTNYGFEAVTAADAPITLNSVSLRGRDEVKFVGAASLLGAKIRYAWSGAANVGPRFGPRGNLRDQQGEDFAGHKAVIFDPTGLRKPMHNWCVIHEFQLP